MKSYYVYDILTNFWSEGGTKKIFNYSRYSKKIEPGMWNTALDAFFEKSMQRVEYTKVSQPKNEDYVLLNSIYMNQFSAKDQLSQSEFDVEHIATKEQMKRLIKQTDETKGLAISCFANLCYLPQHINRSKKDKNFYQDEHYLEQINLKDVETKYSFTEREDLEWMDYQYHDNDFENLKQNYIEFCSKRYKLLKKKFCESMGINYDEMLTPYNELEIENNREDNVSQNGNKNSDDLFAQMLEKKIGESLKKVGRKTYVSENSHKGFILCTSKTYHQGGRIKYWFAYRVKTKEEIENCKQIFVVYASVELKQILVVIPTDIFEQYLPNLISSDDGDGNVSHWHITLFSGDNGIMNLFLSKPQQKEISLGDYSFDKMKF